jgi:hypothetical protein
MEVPQSQVFSSGPSKAAQITPAIKELPDGFWKLQKLKYFRSRTQPQYKKHKTKIQKALSLS